MDLHSHRMLALHQNNGMPLVTQRSGKSLSLSAFWNGSPRPLEPTTCVEESQVLTPSSLNTASLFLTQYLWIFSVGDAFTVCANPCHFTPLVVPNARNLSKSDPFGFSKNKSAEAKERGLVAELNNGRLAQIGILGFLAEQKVEGSVPLLHGLVSHYNGEPMAPVSVLLHHRYTFLIGQCRGVAFFVNAHYSQADCELNHLSFHSFTV